MFEEYETDIITSREPTNLTRKTKRIRFTRREERRITGGRSTLLPVSMSASSSSVPHSASQSSGVRLAVRSSQEERGQSSEHPGMGRVMGLVVVVTGVVLW